MIFETWWLLPLLLEITTCVLAQIATREDSVPDGTPFYIFAIGSGTALGIIIGHVL